MKPKLFEFTSGLRQQPFPQAVRPQAAAPLPAFLQTYGRSEKETDLPVLF